MKFPDLYRLILERRWLQHLAFWLAIAMVFLFDSIEVIGEQNIRFQILTVLPFIILLAMVHYLNVYLLIPRFLFKKKYVAFASGLILLSLIYAYTTGKIATSYLGLETMLIKRMMGCLMMMSVFTSIFLLRSDLKNRQKMEELEKRQQAMELQTLQKHLSPHFLFNTLNTLYALTLTKQQQAPEMILRLSDLLRYILTDAKKNKVSLGVEIAHLENYLSLEKARMNADAKIIFQAPEKIEPIEIAPLLLLPFVENAFKHGVETQRENISLHIELSIRDNALSFKVRNSKPSQSSNSSEMKLGTGIANTRRRLELLYPGERHKIDIQSLPGEFIVNLWIKLN